VGSYSILETAATDGRRLTKYAANSRSNVVARNCWRRKEFGGEGWSMREPGPGEERFSGPCVKGK